MTTSYSTSGPADADGAPPTARACPTTNRGYPYDGPAQLLGQANFGGLDGADAFATLAGRLDIDMTSIEHRLRRMEHASMGQGEFPRHVVDALWVRWNLEVGLGVEPEYTPQPGNHEYAYIADAPRLPWSTLINERGPVRRIGPALHADLVAAILATVGPDVLAAAIGAVQWCGGRLLAVGIDAATAMSAGRPGSWEAAAMTRVLNGGSAYTAPADIIERVGAILHHWVTGPHYAEVAENYAAAVSTAVTAIGLDNIDLETIAEHCNPADRHTGAAGWLTSLVDSHALTVPGGATDAV